MSHRMTRTRKARIERAFTIVVFAVLIGACAYALYTNPVVFLKGLAFCALLGFVVASIELWWEKV
jgi:hypothetical protein